MARSRTRSATWKRRACRSNSGPWSGAAPRAWGGASTSATRTARFWSSPPTARHDVKAAEASRPRLVSRPERSPQSVHDRLIDEVAEQAAVVGVARAGGLHHHEGDELLLGI